MLGRHLDVLVVGKNNDLLCVDRLDGLEELGSRRVHGLAPGDHDVHTETFEDRADPLPGSHGDKAERFRRSRRTCSRRAKARGAGLGLLSHVVDMHLGHLTTDSHVGDHRTRIVGMNVDLEKPRLADHEFGAAHRAHELLNLGDIEVFGDEQELRTVEILIVVPVIDRSHDRIGGRGSSDDPQVELGAAERSNQPLGEYRKSESAGIHHSVLLQDRKQLRGTPYRFDRRGESEVDDIVERGIPAGGRACSSTRIAQNGQHGAFDRLSDRLEGNGCRPFECCGYHLSGISIAGGDDIAQASEDLAQDDARVTASSHQRAVRDCLAQRYDIGICRQESEFGDDGVHGQRHVRACVAVWNRKDIQPIDLLGTLLERRGCRGNQSGKGGE